MSGPGQSSDARATVSIDEGVKYPKVSMLKPKGGPIGANFPIPGSKIARPCSGHTAPKAPLPPPAEPNRCKFNLSYSKFHYHSWQLFIIIEIPSRLRLPRTEQKSV